MERAKHSLDYVRNAYGLSGSFHFYIRRYRKYTDAKGMSESASVATSVAMAMSMLLFQSEADESIISELARFVSGSGTRGIFRGTAFWLSYPGISHRMCHAARVADFPKGLKYGIFPKSSSALEKWGMIRSHGQSNLGQALESIRKTGIKNVFLSGFITEFNILGASFETIKRGMVPVVISDAVSSPNERLHFHGLEILSNFCFIADSRDLMKGWDI